MALIQINVPDDVKVRADAAFARNGITTPGAMKMMVTQVASENRTPFDGLFSVGISRELAQGVRRDMLRVAKVFLQFLCFLFHLHIPNTAA